MKDDYISRQAAIDAADRADYRGLAVEDVRNVTDEVVKELKRVPSAQPQWIPVTEEKQKTGKWILPNEDLTDIELKEYIKKKCYEVARSKHIHENQWRRFKGYINQIDDFGVSVLTSASATMDTFKEYTILRFHVHEFIWALGNDEYKQLWKDIVEGGEG